MTWCVNAAKRLMLIDREQLAAWYRGECTDGDVLEAVATHGESRQAVKSEGHAPGLWSERVRDIQVLVACVNNLRMGLDETGYLIRA
jgi:hypothetical protein